MTTSDHEIEYRRNLIRGRDMEITALKAQLQAANGGNIDMFRFAWLAGNHHAGGGEWHELEGWQRDEINTTIAAALEAWRVIKGSGDKR